MPHAAFRLTASANATASLAEALRAKAEAGSRKPEAGSHGSIAALESKLDRERNEWRLAAMNSGRAMRTFGPGKQGIYNRSCPSQETSRMRSKSRAAYGSP